MTWLEKYLEAKRKVETYIQSKSSLRAVIFRPSLIWTMSRPQALASVVPFYIGSAIGLPFVDRPVLLENLVSSMLAAISNENISGIQRYKEIDALSSSL